MTTDVEAGPWGPWKLDSKTWSLVHPAPYDVPLLDCTSSAGVLNWIAQVAGKTFISESDLGHFVRALDNLLSFQATLCGGANMGDPEKTITSVPDAIRSNLVFGRSNSIFSMPK